jgi:hypothetical protein
LEHFCRGENGNEWNDFSAISAVVPSHHSTPSKISSLPPPKKNLLASHLSPSYKHQLNPDLQSSNSASDVT